MSKVLRLPERLGPGLQRWVLERSGRAKIGTSGDPEPDELEAAQQALDNMLDQGVPEEEASALEQAWFERAVNGSNEWFQWEIKPGIRRGYRMVMGHIWDDPASHGPGPADVMVIGKFLGQEEQVEGRNLCGASGKKLREVALHQKLPCGRWYVTNLLKTVHPDDGNGSLYKHWIDEWLPFLREELKIVRPKYILCLGPEALKALLGNKESLKKAEGRIYELEYDVGVDDDGHPIVEKTLVMACLHPAAVLHKPERIGQLRREIARFGQMTRGVRWDQGETDLDHRVITDWDALLALEQEIKRECKSNLIAIDAEWAGSHPENRGSGMVSIQLSWKHKSAACIGLRTTDGSVRFKGAELADVMLVLKRILKGRQVAGSFIVADLEWLEAEGLHVTEDFAVPETWEEYRDAIEGCKPCGIDIAYAMHAVDETADFGLKAMAVRFTSAPRYDIPLKEWLDAEKARRGKDRSARKRALKAKLKPKKPKAPKKPKKGAPVPPPEELIIPPEFSEAEIASRVEDIELELQSLSDEEEDLGFGIVPDPIRDAYANYDADVTRRIAIKLKKMLAKDEHGNACWKPLWITMRALPAILEINCSGMRVNRDRLDRLTITYMDTQRKLLEQLRKVVHWPEYNPDSHFESREILFGEKFNLKKTADGKVQRIRPPGAKSLYMVPTLTTDKRSMLWEEVVEKELEAEKTPSCGRMAVALLLHKAKKVKRVSKDRKVSFVDCSEPLTLFRNYKVVAQILRSSLRKPRMRSNGEFIRRDDGWLAYSKGLPGGICDDGRVRTHIYPTKETGRWSSSRVPLHNLSKRREDDYKKILKEDYPYPLRSILEAAPGCLLVEADYIGAELFGMAILAGDEAMIRDAFRNQLPETDPDFYDIHSNIAVEAFQLRCEPTKAGLDSIGKKYLRDIAKTVIFGIAYGRQAKAIAVAAREQNVPLTEEEAEAVRQAVFKRYPRLEPFFEECRARALNQRFMCGFLGRYRRFPETDDRKIMGDLEREAMNFPIQGMIADQVSRAVDYLLQVRKECGLTFRLVMQIHDAIILEVPYAEVGRVSDYVLPQSMRERVPIYPTDLDGRLTGAGPFHLGIDTNIYQNWGIQMYPEQVMELGVDPKYAGWVTLPSGGWSHPGKSGKIWVNGGWVELAA